MPSVDDLPKKRRQGFRNGTFNTDYKGISKAAIIKEFVDGPEVSLVNPDEVSFWTDSFYDWVVDGDLDEYSSTDFFEYQNADTFGFDFFD